MGETDGEGEKCPSMDEEGGGEVLLHMMCPKQGGSTPLRRLGRTPGCQAVSIYSFHKGSELNSQLGSIVLSQTNKSWFCDSRTAEQDNWSPWV